MTLDLSSGRPPSSSHPSLENGSFLSRFRAHLGQRNRNITDFYIEPDDPWRSYFPGDSIKGTVVLTVVRPVRITHLVICLHGYVKVFKNTTAPGDSRPDIGYMGPGRGRRGSEYLGNGLASLFEDEIVLCGDGRLKEGIYKFRFEIGFPPYPLPSSINFERGTVSYMLTSTLTRPTTIAPILTCRRRVNLLENLDIAPFPAPKPRVVTLEPISRRSKSKGKSKSPTSSDAADQTPSRDPSVSGTMLSEQHPPLSPVSSDVSSSSRRSNSSQSFQFASEPQSSVSTNGASRSLNGSVADGTITVTTELLRAGVLPGDTIPVVVTINHCKQVRRPHGIIITLYRQGRIDLHPAIPMGAAADGKKPVYEDCYPRSRTGLGGLTFGTSRTSSVFRKDLSQTFAPLIVDPVSMTATVKASVRVPEDAFPTITRVPGGMISFRYYVEVVVDLRGKLAAADRFLPRFNMVSGGSTFSPSGQVINAVETGGNSVTASWSGHILDTDQIRRAKGVIAVAFEAVVGTRDSQRRVIQKDMLPMAGNTPTIPPSAENDPAASMSAAGGYESQYWHELQPNEGELQSHADYGYLEEAQWPAEYHEDYPGEYSQPYQSIQQVIAPPQVEEPRDEKARLRQAEEMLLPSLPPNENGSGPSTGGLENTAPSAPVLLEDDHLNDYQHLPSTSPGTGLASEGGGPAVPRVIVEPAVSAASSETVTLAPILEHSQRLEQQQQQQQPQFVDGRESEPPLSIRDDKQELERQRLLGEASAPGDFATPSFSTRTPSQEEHAPSAPVIHEDAATEDGNNNNDSVNINDDHDRITGGAASHDEEALPRYQR